MMLGSTFRQRKRARFTKRSVGSGSLVPVSKLSAELNMAREVQKLKKYVKGLKPEIKFADITLASTNISPTAGVTVHMTAIAQGIAVNQRIGENVQVRHVEFHGEVTYANSVGSSTNDTPTYRVYIVQDMQQIASTSPSVADLVDQPSTPVYQLYNVSEQKRFRVLYDSGPQMLSFGTPAITPPVNSNVVQMARYQLHLKKRVSIPVEFNSTGSSTIQKNGIYFMLSTDISASGTPCLDWLGSSRIGFTDS